MADRVSAEPSEYKILTINVGSSSVKCAVHHVAGSRVRTLAETSNTLVEGLQLLGSTTPDAVGHRVVHGGSNYTGPVIINSDVLDNLHSLVPFAPLHQPPALVAIAAAEKAFPDAPQIACFDTAFHHTMPESSQRLPLPAWTWAEGIRRYGFHGLSYEHVVQTLGAETLGRAVIAHLGAGASLCAVRNGTSLDTTMGFTPAGGLMMATRPGDLDPGVLVHLARARGYDAEAMDSLVNHESGLLGVSETTADMRALLEQRSNGNKPSELAFEMFCSSIRKHIGSFVAVLGGLDTLVFTGGIGEHSAAVRREVCNGLGVFGIALDQQRNTAQESSIGSADSPVAVHVVPTNEAEVIARHTAALLQTS